MFGMWKLKSCRKCGGDLRLDYHQDVGYFWVCAQCSSEPPVVESGNIGRKKQTVKV